MTDPDFAAFMKLHKALLKKANLDLIQVIRRYVAGIMQMDAEQAILVIQELSVAQDRLTPSNKDEFNRIMKDGFRK